MPEPRTELARQLVNIHERARDVRLGELVETAELVHYLSRFSTDELDVLGYVAERLDHGRTIYGPLDVANDPRAWDRELEDELLDTFVYTGILKLIYARHRTPALSVIHPNGAEDIEFTEV